MKTSEIQLAKGQYLSEVYPLIESNIILNKRLSGVGATHCEIISPRNSIIVVPNTPIIDCKVNKHRHSDNLFGVMSMVTVTDIVQYLRKTVAVHKYIKIMVTPESFYKVRQAFDEICLNMYDSCFLMLDECHKFITERDFRKDIILPFNSFFKFKNKALVSATPIIPSDPRFDEHNFRLVEVLPQNFERFEILIIRTNDLRQAFKAEYSWVNITKGRIPKRPQCIFVNSADIIEDLITQSNLHEISSIFCSSNSASRLKGRGFNNVHTEWKEEYQNTFMFFTSRFYTGLDIYLPNEPNVIYMSDAINAHNTLMDPYTDMAQACGRFRNGMKNIFHYVVFNSEIEYQTEKEIEDYLGGIQKSFQALSQIYEQSQSESEKKAILKSIQSLPYNEIFFDGEIDYFLKDNLINTEWLKQIYRNYDTLKDAYGASGYLQVPLEETHFYLLDNKFFKNKQRLSNVGYKRKQREAIVESLKYMLPYRHTFAVEDIINTFRNHDKTIVDAFFKLGYDFIIQCNYNIKRIKEELHNRNKESDSLDSAFLHTISQTFEIGKTYLRSYVKEELGRIYYKFGIIPPSTITGLSLRWHFDIDEKARIGNQKAIRILAPKAQGLVDYFEKIKHNALTEDNHALED